MRTPANRWRIGVAAAIATTASLATGVAQDLAADRFCGQRVDRDLAGPGVHSSCRPRIAATRHHLHVVWQDARDSEWAIWRRRTDASGKSWDADDVRLSAPGEACVDPHVVASDDCVHVVWRVVARAGRPTREHLCATTSFDEGATWTDVVSLDPDDSSSCDFVGSPEVAAIGHGGACLAWIQAIGDEDRALIAMHRGPGTSWPKRPLRLTTIAGSRARCVQVTAVAKTSSTAGAVHVAYVEGNDASSQLVLRSSADEGASFPESLTTVLASNTAASSVALAANRGGTVELVWREVDAASGSSSLLSQRSRQSGAPGSWLARPSRVDDASVERVGVYDASVAVDAAGDAIAVYATARTDESHGGRIAVDVVANSCPATAAPDEAWRRERIVSTRRTSGLTTFVRLEARLRAGSNGDDRTAAIAWSEDPATNDARARLWIGATTDGGESWTTQPLDRVGDPNAPRADHCDFVLRQERDAAPSIGLVWDDRRYWSPPGTAFTSGRGAPETCFLELELPCAKPRSR